MAVLSKLAMAMGLAALPLAVFAAEVSTKVLTLLHKQFPPHRFAYESAAYGDLNGDGKEDFAVLVLTSGPEGQSDPPQRRMIVGISLAKGGYRPLLVSGDLRPQGLVNTSLAIKKNKLFLTRESVDGCCPGAGWIETYQFNTFQGEIVLVEQKYSETTTSEPAHHFGNSKHYLSNEAVFWRQSGNQRMEVRRTLQTYPLLKLSEFDIDKLDKFLPNERRGFIDEKFKFHD